MILFSRSVAYRSERHSHHSVADAEESRISVLAKREPFDPPAVYGTGDGGRYLVDQPAPFAPRLW